MTAPVRHANEPLFPHVETVRDASVRPAVDDPDLDSILQQGVEAQVRLIATLLPAYLRTPDGKAAILAALDPDDIKRLARETAVETTRHTIATTPVPPHEHRADRVSITTATRGLSRIGALIGAVIGGLLAWLLVANYTVTTVTFGNEHEMHSASVNWMRTAIVAVVVLFFGIVGALIGPRKKQEQIVHANIRLGNQHVHRGRVPSYGAVAATARHTTTDKDNQ